MFPIHGTLPIYTGKRLKSSIYVHRVQKVLSVGTILIITSKIDKRILSLWVVLDLNYWHCSLSQQHTFYIIEQLTVKLWLRYCSETLTCACDPISSLLSGNRTHKVNVRFLVCKPYPVPLHHNLQLQLKKNIWKRRHHKTDN